LDYANIHQSTNQSILLKLYVGIDAGDIELM